MNAYIVLGFVILLIVFKILSPVVKDVKEIAREKTAISKLQ